MYYDYIIIGAGIAGCAIAHQLHVKKQRVLLVDENGLLSGASKAAGAFLSPLDGKKNPYNTLVNDALTYALSYYSNLSSEHIIQKGLLRVAKNEKEALKQDRHSLNFFTRKKLQQIDPHFGDIEGIYHPNAAIVDGVKMAEVMVKDIAFKQLTCKTIEHSDGYYVVEGIKSKHIILTTGANPSLFAHPYIDITPAYGLRLEAKTAREIPFNIHRKFSLSTRRKSGTIAIGATNAKTAIIDDIPLHVETLLNEVKSYMQLDDLELLEHFIGARATIKSYFPVVGALIDAKRTLQAHPSIMKGTKVPKEKLHYFENVYILNALGSRGFVFAPYLAKLLSEHLLEGMSLPKEIDPATLFYKYARREPTL